jgi:hypothetical protein
MHLASVRTAFLRFSGKNPADFVIKCAQEFSPSLGFNSQGFLVRDEGGRKGGWEGEWERGRQLSWFTFDCH